MNCQELLPLDDALKCLKNQAWKLAFERLPLQQVHLRVLQEPCCADMDMPPFNKSAMDGFACRRQDIKHPLRIIETIQAGAQPRMPVEPMECSKIMTGASVPVGADCVVPVEFVHKLSENEVAIKEYNGGTNICLQGEDIRIGDILIKPGTVILPQHVGVMAAMGYTTPLVGKQPKIGIFATGNELVEPEFKPTPGCIRNSNAAQLISLLQSMGLSANYYGIVLDDEAILRSTIARAIEEQDLIITTGGVSEGEFDHMPNLLSEMGFTLHFRKVAIQPGKPVTFATTKNNALFALSGNPVSSFLQFLLLVKPFIFWLQGMEFDIKYPYASLDSLYRRKHGDRAQWIPVHLTNSGTLQRLPFHGSAHLSALLDATAFAEIPEKTVCVDEGTLLRYCILNFM